MQSKVASGWIVEEGESSLPEVAPIAETIDGESEGARGSQLSGWALVLLGVIGGVYLLYTTVWFSWANYYSTVNSAAAEGSGAIGSVLQQIVFWIAPFAPALWFGSVLVLQRGAKLWKLVTWLVVGVVVLVPLPMFEGML